VLPSSVILTFLDILGRLCHDCVLFARNSLTWTCCGCSFFVA
jgi:hypothetical protein